MTALLFTSALATALVAGIFYAFSTFVMGALARLEPRTGIASMQSINIVVLNPLFFLAFFGAGILSLAALLTAWLTTVPHGLPLIAAGTGLYLLGCIGVTIVGNVPLNERLAKVEPDSTEAAELWQLYLRRWTRWNHIRTAASLAAAAAFVSATISS